MDGPRRELSFDARSQAAASFGARLRGFRAQAGLSQEALAERAGLGLATLKALERDQRSRPHPHTLALLADALGLAPADRAALLDGTSMSDRPLTREQPGVAGPRLPVWLTSFVG